MPRLSEGRSTARHTLFGRISLDRRARVGPMPWRSESRRASLSDVHRSDDGAKPEFRLALWVCFPLGPARRRSAYLSRGARRVTAVPH